METQRVEKILGRKLHSDLLNTTSDKKILITGGKGSIGQRLAQRCPNAVVTDIDELDVVGDWGSWELETNNWFFRPEVVVHLAGAKHAPVGEDNCMDTLYINTFGVDNGLKRYPNAHHVLASTCKACNPETVYGATKLISERLILNAGGSVARFYNVVETSGNVFEIWDSVECVSNTVKQILEGEVLPVYLSKDLKPREVYPCQRYFISVDEAVGLLIHCIENKGRYSVNPGDIREMTDIFNDLGYTGEIKQRRRGDRQTELLCSTSETIEFQGSLIKITSHNDVEHS